jgi:hypothetical protein
MQKSESRRCDACQQYWCRVSKYKCHRFTPIQMIKELAQLLTSNEVVEKVYSYPHRAVNQTKYQGRSWG